MSIKKWKKDFEFLYNRGRCESVFVKPGRLLTKILPFRNPTGIGPLEVLQGIELLRPFQVHLDKKRRMRSLRPVQRGKEVKGPQIVMLYP